MAKTTSVAPRHFADTFLGRVLIGTTVGAIGFVAGVLQPFWPTEPDFDTGAPSLASPFDVPFTVTNRSKLFKITNLKIVCELIEVKTRNNNGVANMSLNVAVSNFIEPQEAPIYTCPLHRIIALPQGDPIVSAVMRFKYSYSQSGFWNDTEMPVKHSPVFSLLTDVVPARWTAQRRLN
ncbi:MAG: hypothetical protein QHD01_01085 [Bradyrhizobium sp.]|uniref:hypothetical protein n=1 Tax=Bradyrhizobium sp. TaxID=376 RepID=UPI0029B684C1|nr:hypothetical protein [Bradyrhizobium sp.]MDX3965174.1 hypothetical protein [Bradyrhizobium sp.]